MFLQNAVGVSNEDLQDLKTRLENEAAELVGEVCIKHIRYNMRCDWSDGCNMSVYI
jgi:hypothetical protein